MKTIDFGISPYRVGWEKQKKLQTDIIESKRKGLVSEEYVLLGEHTPVITIGFHGDISNLLADVDHLERIGCECIRIERGGDITFHGPGQLIVYPIIDLNRHGLGVKQYVSLLEESVIRFLAEYGIIGERVEGATGVWIGKGTSAERKICAIGIKISRGVTMHGLALNVNTDLSYFNLINPCGFKEKGVTSLAQETGVSVPIEEVKNKFVRILRQLIG